MFQVMTTYFEKPGPANTDMVMEIARGRAQELGIKTIVVATTTGATAIKAAQVFQGCHVVAVSSVTGHKKPDVQAFTPEMRAQFEALGGTVITAAHALGGFGRAVRRRLNTYQLDEIVAHALRILGEGYKVVVEIAAMAVDAGLARTDEDVIAIGGTGKGADFAAVIRPANTMDFFNIVVKEILCKPHGLKPEQLP